MSTLTVTRDTVIDLYRSRLADPSSRKKVLPKKDFEIMADGFIDLLAPLSDPAAIDFLVREELALLETGLRQWDIVQEYAPIYVYLVREAIDEQRLSLPPNKSLHPALRIFLAYQQGQSLAEIPVEDSNSPVIDRLLALSDSALFDRITEISDELRKLQEIFSFRSGLAPNLGFVAPRSNYKYLDTTRKCRQITESVMSWNKINHDRNRRFAINDCLILKLTGMNKEFIKNFVENHSDAINRHHRELQITDREIIENQRTYWRANNLYGNPVFLELLNYCNKRMEFGGSILVQPDKITPYPS